MATKFKVEKEKLLDSMGRPLTQSLFLEINYNTEFAIYTLGDEDKVYEGKTYPSLKKLYLEMEDVVEYDFAKTYLLGWSHWQRLNSNKVLAVHFQEWREELALAIRSNAVKAMLDQALEGNNFQATKWLAEGAWDKRRAGRPSKEEVAKETAIARKLHEEFAEDFNRLSALN